MPIPLTQHENLAYSTARIECLDGNGSTSTGTGFFFNFSALENLEAYIPTIITNKHVVKGAIVGKITFTICDSDELPSNKQFIIDWGGQEGDLTFEEFWTMHPDPDVDLCVILLSDIKKRAYEQGFKLYTFPFTEGNIVGHGIPENVFDAAENVLMIGYPNGLWDNINNTPIMRKGIMATHIASNYRGKREFMVDMACFPGSSGSPIVIVDGQMGEYKINDYGRQRYNRITLLGILFSGPIMTATGEIEIVTIPTSSKPVAYTQLMLHLGYAIKAIRILDLKEALYKRYKPLSK
jgi:hypothetical protein